MGSGYVTTWEREIEKRERPITSDGRKQISRIDVRHTFSSSSNGDPCQARQRMRRRREKDWESGLLAAAHTATDGLFGLWTSNQSLSLLDPPPHRFDEAGTAPRRKRSAARHGGGGGGGHD